MSAIPIASAPVNWVSEKDIKNCQICSQPFTLLVRKHHCRQCGRVVCSTDSQYRLPPSNQPNSNARLRTCTDCFKLREQSEVAAQQTIQQILPTQAAPQAAPVKPIQTQANGHTASSKPATSDVAAHKVETPALTPAPASAPAVSVSTTQSTNTAASVTKTDAKVNGGHVAVSTVSSAVNSPAPAVLESPMHLRPQSSEEDPHTHPGLLTALEDAGGSAANDLPSPTPTLIGAVSNAFANTNGLHKRVVAPPALTTSASALNATSSTFTRSTSAQSFPSRSSADSSLPPSASPVPQKVGSVPASPNPLRLTVDGIRRRKSSADRHREQRRASLSEAEKVSELAAIESDKRNDAVLAFERDKHRQEHPDQLTAATHNPITDSTKLDLPLKLCLVILKSTHAEMKQRYASYIETKHQRGEDALLSFSQYLFFSTIRTLPDFLFKKTELSHCMMREEGSSTVRREQFERYAPILAPLASKLDASAVFSLLATIQPDSPAPAITLQTFVTYVEHLKKVLTTAEQWPDYRDVFNLPKNEDILVIRNGVTDSTTFPPQLGRLGICTHHLLFESVFFKKRKCIAWTDIMRVEKNDGSLLRRGTGSYGIKLLVREWEESDGDADEIESVVRHRKRRSQQSWLYIDTPGISHEVQLERARTLCMVQIMQISHRIAAQLAPADIAPVIVNDIPTAKPIKSSNTAPPSPTHKSSDSFNLTSPSNSSANQSDRLLAAAILQESFDTVRRMRAMEGIPNVDPTLMCPYSDVSQVDQSAWIDRVREVVLKTEQIKKSKTTWLTKVLPGLAPGTVTVTSANGSATVVQEDIDPELRFDYKSFEEMNKRTAIEHEQFSIKSLAYNVRLFRHQVLALWAIYLFIKKLRAWDYPVATAFTIALLLNMSYRDTLSYIPAVFILCNIVALIVMRWFPSIITDLLLKEERMPDKHGDGEIIHLSTVDSGDEAEPNDAVVYAVHSGTGKTVPLTTPAVSVSPTFLAPPNQTMSPQTADIVSPTSPGAPVASPVTPTTGVGENSESRKKKRDHANSKDREKGEKGKVKKAAAAPSGILARMKNLRDGVFKTRDLLEIVQNFLMDRNVETMRIEGLYKWRSSQASQRYLVVLCLGFIMFVFVPFRFIFPFMVIDFFTQRWQSDGGTLTRIVESVPLPEKWPQFD